MLRLSVLLFLILMNVSFILYSFIFDIEYTQELVRLEIAKKYTQNNNSIKVSDQNNFIKTKNIRKQYNSLNKVVQNNKAIQNYDKLLYEFELYLTELKSNTITNKNYIYFRTKIYDIKESAYKAVALVSLAQKLQYSKLKSETEILEIIEEAKKNLAKSNNIKNKFEFLEVAKILMQMEQYTQYSDVIMLLRLDQDTEYLFFDTCKYPNFITYYKKVINSKSLVKKYSKIAKLMRYCIFAKECTNLSYEEIEKYLRYCRGGFNITWNGFIANKVDVKQFNYPAIAYLMYSSGNIDKFLYYKNKSTSPQQLIDMKVQYYSYIESLSRMLLKTNNTTECIKYIKTISNSNIRIKTLLLLSFDFSPESLEKALNECTK